MKPQINYVTLDGRGNENDFQQCVLTALADLKTGDGLHVIKDFEPFPLYALMQKKGFEKQMEKVSETEYHVWFFPVKPIEEMEMGKHLTLDNERIRKMLDIKAKVFQGELTPDAARKLVNETFSSVTPEEFAFGEQHILSYGITNEVMVDGMDDIIDVFRDVLTRDELNLPEGHPLRTYQQEADALESLLLAMENQLKKKFIKNEWFVLYEKLLQINTHFSRKQHQLFSALERVGFDRPSKVMWTFDNKVRDTVKEAFVLLNEDKDDAFLAAQPNVFYLVRDILDKERTVLYPTSLKLLTDDDFALIRASDDEIGYCLIPTPPPFGKVSQNKTEPEIAADTTLLADLQVVMRKHGLTTPVNDGTEVLDVATGKLTLQQINLIFRHLQIDLSYVDENDIVKFYSDTKHRVFPRSAGVIGREVQNCHPRESVATVEAIIKAFREGKQDEAEFWIQMGDKFVYIIYNAVRDDAGNFRGVLEMMQDATHIRSLTGSRKLLTWGEESNAETINHHHASETTPEEEVPEVNTIDDINENTVIAPLLKKYPFLKEFLIQLNSKYKQLNNPIVFNTMGNIASLEMIAKRGGYPTEEFVEMLRSEVKRQSGK